MSTQEFGIGPTAELNLRVSAATLSRVIFPSPVDGGEMLALENKATLIRKKSKAEFVLQAQPFGGAVRLSDPGQFQELVGNFNYDSQRSMDEQDFRVYISPKSWPALRDYSRQYLHQIDNTWLDSDPLRELVEEFEDTLGIELRPDQYAISPAGIVIENEPAPSSSLRAAGNLTVRIYWLDEVRILDSILYRIMLENSQANSNKVLMERAEADAFNGGQGRANAILAVSLEEITNFYLGMDPGLRGERQLYKEAVLAGNVAAVLRGIEVPKYITIG